MMESLSERKKLVLRSVITEYIVTAEPVASRTVVRKYGLPLSPATVRNVMAELEEMGFLTQPHASAGRVPTERGMRFYVDSILELSKLREEEKQQLRQACQVETLEVHDLLRRISQVLSRISGQVAVVTAPRAMDTVFKHVEFIRMGPRRVLVILVTSEGMVQNRIVDLEEDIGQRELYRLAEHLNGMFSGLSLRQALRRLRRQMRRERALCDRLMARALQLGRKALLGAEEVEVYLEGKTNLLENPEFAEVDRIRGLLRALEEKKLLLRLLDRTIRAKGVQILIGSETELEEMRGCSLITSSYQRGEHVLGTLGVIGPVRMDYLRLIPLVDCTAKLVSEVLEAR